MYEVSNQKLSVSRYLRARESKSPHFTLIELLVDSACFARAFAFKKDER